MILVKRAQVSLEHLTVVLSSEGGLDDQWSLKTMWELPGGTPSGLKLFSFHNYLDILYLYIFINSLYLDPIQL